MKKILTFAALLLGIGGYVGYKHLYPPEPPAPTPPAIPQASPPRVEPMRTWTFRRAGKIEFSGGGAISVQENGRTEAAYLRIDQAFVYAKLLDGSLGAFAIEDLSTQDRAYLSLINGVQIDEAATDLAIAAQKDALAKASRNEAATAAYQEERETDSNKQWDAKAKEEAAARAKKDRKEWGEVEAWKRNIRPNWHR